MCSIGPPNRKELSSSWNGWLVINNDGLMGNCGGSVRDIHDRTVPQYTSPITTAAIFALMLNMLGTVHVLRPPLVTKEMSPRCHYNLHFLLRHPSWCRLWYSGTWNYLNDLILRFQLTMEWIGLPRYLVL